MQNNRISFPKGSWKLFSLILFATIEVGIYFAIIKTESKIGYIAFYALTGILAIICFLLSGGGKKEVPEKKDLRDGFSDEKKERIISFLKKGREINKTLIPILVPLLFIAGFDFVRVIFF